MTTSTTPQSPHGIGRRTIVTGAAWSVPTIAIAVAAPLAAASDGPVVTPTSGTTITTWKADHHYGSTNEDPEERSYDFPVFVTDSTGRAIEDAVVTVVATGANRDGDILAVYPWPAPSTDGPEESPSPSASLSAGPGGRYLFAVSTQNLSEDELPADATLTISVTSASGSTTSTVAVHLTESD